MERLPELMRRATAEVSFQIDKRELFEEQKKKMKEMREEWAKLGVNEEELGKLILEQIPREYFIYQPSLLERKAMFEACSLEERTMDLKELHNLREKLLKEQKKKMGEIVAELMAKGVRQLELRNVIDYDTKKYYESRCGSLQFEIDQQLPTALLQMRYLFFLMNQAMAQPMPGCNGPMGSCPFPTTSYPCPSMSDSRMYMGQPIVPPGHPPPCPPPFPSMSYFRPFVGQSMAPPSQPSPFSYMTGIQSEMQPEMYQPMANVSSPFAPTATQKESQKMNKNKEKIDGQTNSVFSEKDMKKIREENEKLKEVIGECVSMGMEKGELKRMLMEAASKLPMEIPFCKELLADLSPIKDTDTSQKEANEEVHDEEKNQLEEAKKELLRKEYKCESRQRIKETDNLDNSFLPSPKKCKCALIEGKDSIISSVISLQKKSLKESYKSVPLVKKETTADSDSEFYDTADVKNSSMISQASAFTADLGDFEAEDNEEKKDHTLVKVEAEMVPLPDETNSQEEKELPMDETQKSEEKLEFKKEVKASSWMRSFFSIWFFLNLLVIAFGLGIAYAHDENDQMYSKMINWNKHLGMPEPYPKYMKRAAEDRLFSYSKTKEGRFRCESIKLVDFDHKTKDYKMDVTALLFLDKWARGGTIYYAVIENRAGEPQTIHKTLHDGAGAHRLVVRETITRNFEDAPMIGLKIDWHNSNGFDGKYEIVCSDAQIRGEILKQIARFEKITITKEKILKKIADGWVMIKKAYYDLFGGRIVL